FCFSRQSVSQGDQETILIRIGGKQLDSFSSEGLPRKALRAHTERSPRIVKLQDLTIVATSLPHRLGASLAKPHSVAGSAAIEYKTVTIVTNLIQIAANQIPSERPSHGEPKRRSGNRDSTAF